MRMKNTCTFVGLILVTVLELSAVHYYFHGRKKQSPRAAAVMNMLKLIDAQQKIVKKDAMIADHIFRQYDIRGIVGDELPIDQAARLTRAIAAYFIEKNPAIKTVAVGADGRIHSPALKKAVCSALQESGLDVVYVGTCPTPLVYYSVHNLSVDAGLMITASHNGKEYNGIKICLGTESLSGDEIQEIKKLYHQEVSPKIGDRGAYQEYPVMEEYISYLVQQFEHLKGMELKAVIDCGNGAAGTVLPQLIERMQWSNVDLLYPEVDGEYPNHQADPVVAENMRKVQEILQTTDTEVGLGFDGDCDRMAPMTKTGELVTGDKLLALFAKPVAYRNPNASVVFDVTCSTGLPELLCKWHARPCLSAPGHSIIKNEMKRTGALLAGEMSCHFFFADRYFGYDDGIYAMFRLFELLQEAGATLDELLQEFPQKVSTAEIRIPCPEEQKRVIVAAVKTYFDQREDVGLLELDGIRVANEHGWALLRASNTQPAICLRFEADSQEELYSWRQLFADLLQPYFDPEVLQQHGVV